jgi:NADH:ubiquinone oxidoreductase subunit 3 (subunit A)
MVKNKKIVLEKSGEKEEKNKVAFIEKFFNYSLLFIVFLFMYFFFLIIGYFFIKLALMAFAEHPIIILIFIISIILTLITLYLIKGDDTDEK